MKRSISPVTRFAFLFAVYVAYIVVFAAYYTWGLVGHFRFSGVTHEEAYRESREELADRVAQALLSEEAIVSFMIKSAQFVFEKKDISVLELDLLLENATPTMVSFGGVFTLMDDKTRRFLDGCSVYQSADCLFDETRDGSIRLAVERCHFVSEPRLGPDVTIYCMAGGPLNEQFFAATAENFGLYTQLDDELAQEIRFFGKAETHLEKGRFERMLYFSAVTATTLGYGDIVPLTTAARMSIAFQSVFGLFLMGWMVFSITSGGQTVGLAGSQNREHQDPRGKPRNHTGSDDP